MGVTGPIGGTNRGSARGPRVTPFGKYLLLERVAVGGMAEVYLAKSFGVEGFEKIIAIKRILPTMAEDDDFIAMFIDEAKIAGQLTHPNIAPIFELGKIGDSHYIAMEYIWGKDLLQIMNRFRRMRKRMPPSMVAWAASRMCEALAYAHAKTDRHGASLGIIHRDVSPQNVLCSYEGEIKLIDFGIAKAASRTTKTQAGVLKGKFGYMSPEQVRGLPVDSRSDLFAVGTCMYEMLTCERLFMGESDFSTLEKVRNASVPPVGEVAAGIAPELNHIVMKALQREASDRWQTARELQRALGAYLGRQSPEFTAQRMSSWLKNAFATEMDQERERLKTLARVGRPTTTSNPRPSVEPRTTPRAASDQDADSEYSDDETVRQPSPFDGPNGSVGEPQTEQSATTSSYDDGAPTKIYFSSGELDHPTITDQVPGGSGDPSAATMVLPPGVGSVPLNASVPAGFPPAAEVPGSIPPAFGTTGPLPAVPASPRPPSLAPPSQGAVGSVPAGVPSGVPGPRRSNARWAGVYLLLAAVIVGLGVGIAFIVFRGAPTGTLEIRTTPSVGATVKVDEVPRGRAPLRIQQVSAGDHLIEVEADGYETVVRRVPVAGGSFSTFAISLVETRTRRERTPASTAPTEAPPPDQPAPTKSAAPESAESEPAQESRAAARAALRERIAERRAAERAERLANERAAAEERRRQAEEQREEARARRQEAARERAAMRQAAREASQSVLRINSIPRSEVTVDGQSRGHTPIMSLRVSPGVHRIELRTGDGRTHSRVVTLEPGETTSVGHQF